MPDRAERDFYLRRERGAERRLLLPGPSHGMRFDEGYGQSRLAQLVERKTLNLVVVGSSPTVGVILFLYAKIYQYSPFFTIK